MMSLQTVNNNLFYRSLPLLTVNGTVRIPFDLPRLLFEKKLPSIYCSYKSYEYCGNPMPDLFVPFLPFIYLFWVIPGILQYDNSDSEAFCDL